MSWHIIQRDKVIKPLDPGVYSILSRGLESILNQIECYITSWPYIMDLLPLRYLITISRKFTDGYRFREGTEGFVNLILGFRYQTSI